MAEPWSAVPEWIGKAEGDWEAVKILLTRNSPRLRDAVVFHAYAHEQQHSEQRCSAADQPVVLGMTTDPEPMNAGIGRQAQGSVVETNSHAVEPATGQKLELE